MPDKQDPVSRIANPFITRRLKLPEAGGTEVASPVTAAPPRTAPRVAPALRRLAASLALFLVALGLLGATAYLDRLANLGVVRGPDLTPIPHTGGSPVGVNVFLEKEADPANRERSLQVLAGANVKWIRQTFPWNDIEIHGKGDFEDRRGPSTQSAWDKYDHIVETAGERGIQILARIDAPPLWARAPDADVERFHKGPPHNYQDFADFVSAVVARYKGQVRYFQLWNEPNLEGEWGGPADARAYAELLRVGYLAAKRANPDAVVLMASLAQTTERLGQPGWSENELIYLQKMYDAGAKPYFDAGSVMVYGLGYGPDQRTTDLRRPGDNERVNFSRALLFRAVMERNGDAAKPVWASEYAWLSLPDDWLPSYKLTWGRSVDEETQARYLVEGYRRAQAEWPWMGPMFIWHLRDPTPLSEYANRANAEWRWFALLNEDFSPRPAFTALSEYAARFPIAGTGAYTADSPALSWSASGGSIRFDGTRLDLVIDPGRDLRSISGTIDGRVPAGWRSRGREGGGMFQVPSPAADGSRMVAVPNWPGPQGVTAHRLLVVEGLPAGEHRFEFSLDRGAGAEQQNPGEVLLGYVVSREDSAGWHFPIAYSLLTIVLVWTAARFTLGLARLPRVLSASMTQPGVAGARAAAAIASVALAATLAAYYFAPYEPLALLALAVWLALAAWQPRSALVVTVVVIPFYWVPRLMPLPFAAANGAGAVASLPLSETCLWLTLFAWGLHRLLHPRGTGADGATGVGVTGYLNLLHELQGPIPWRERFGSWLERRFKRPAAAEADAGVTGYLELYEELQGPATWRERVVGWLRRDLFGLPGLAWLAIGTFSLLTAADPGFLKDSLRSYRWVIVEPVLLYFLATDVMRGRHLALRLLDGFAVGVTFAAIMGLAQSALKASVLEVEGVERIQGAFPHPNNLAIMLGRGLTLVGVTGLFLQDPAERTRRRWYILGSLVMLPALLLTFSRGGYVAFAAALFAALLVANRRWAGVALGLAVAGLGGLLVAAAADLLPARLIGAGSSLIRLDLWQSALAMLADHPIFGVGLDQFLNQYRAVYMPLTSQDQQWLSHPHNLILDCWLSLGIIGMLIGGWIATRYWRAGLALSRRSDPVQRAVALGAFAMLIDFLVHGMVDNSYFLQDLALTFWLACALLQLVRRGG